MYLFSVVREKIVCIVCNKGASEQKEYSLPRHDETMYKEKFGHLVGKLR
jgi:hypothetical protein